MEPLLKFTNARVTAEQIRRSARIRVDGHPASHNRGKLQFFILRSAYSFPKLTRCPRDHSIVDVSRRVWAIFSCGTGPIDRAIMVMGDTRVVDTEKLKKLEAPRGVTDIPTLSPHTRQLRAAPL